MRSSNRITCLQPDYILLIVSKPVGWKPKRIDDAPPGGRVLFKHYVASYGEALDDLVRCNQIAIRDNLSQWAVIQAPSGGL